MEHCPAHEQRARDGVGVRAGVVGGEQRGKRVGTSRQRISNGCRGNKEARARHWRARLGEKGACVAIKRWHTFEGQMTVQVVEAHLGTQSTKSIKITFIHSHKHGAQLHKTLHGGEIAEIGHQDVNLWCSNE